MGTEPNLWAERWRRIATLRRRLELIADGCLGVAAGGAAAHAENLGDAIAVGLGAAVAFDVAWHWCQAAGVRWRRHHRRGWARELPSVAGSVWCLGVCAYCIAVTLGQVPPWGAVALGGVWGALLVLILAGHARRVRRRAERLAREGQ